MQVPATARSVEGSLSHIASLKGKAAKEEDSKTGNKNNDGHHKTHTFSMKLLRQIVLIAVSVIQSSAQRRPQRLSRSPSGPPFRGRPGAARWAGPLGAGLVGGAGAPAGGWATERLGGARSGLGS